MPGSSIAEAARCFGEPFLIVGKEPKETLLSRIADVSEPNTYSGNFGLGEFPHHTDYAHVRLPPPVLMLRCITGYKSVATPLIDGDLLVGNIGRKMLLRSLVKPRKPATSSFPIFAIYCENNGVSLLRWDEVFLRPASKVGNEGFLAMQREISLTVKTEIVLWNPGDTLIINNHRMLHGRSRVLPEFIDRKIERIYLGAVR